MLQLEKTSHLSQVIGSEKTEAWRKRENTLMATVFGFAAYLPFEILLGPILGKARLVGNSCQGFPGKIGDGDIEEVELWEKLGDIKKHSQPLLKIGNRESCELDALWSFKEFNLIIEAKKIKASFGPEQLHKYMDAFKSTGKPLWVLVVGKGLAAVRSLAGFKVKKDVNLLYVDWESILGVVTKQLENNQPKEAYIRRCLKDIKTSLERRDLKPFDGFFCQDKTLGLQSNKNGQRSVGANWFPSSLWTILPDRLSGINLGLNQWLTKQLWVLNQETILKFSPIPWLIK